jgi:signal transduction histidine kinase
MAELAPDRPLSHRARVATVAALAVLALGVFGALVGRLGSMAGAVALVPTLAAGRLLGLRGGLLAAGLLCVAMNVIVLRLGPEFWPVADLAMGVTTLLLSGALMGRLQDLRLQVADTVRERVLAEARARMATSERLASLGTLAASIAHEVNNPMSFILANLEYAQEALAEPNVDLAEVRTAIDEAREGADRVRAIVADMRSLSRGTDEPLRPIEPTAAIKSALNLAGPALKHSVTLQLQLGPVPSVLATEARLGQVVMNLVMNATQAMPQRLASSNRVLVVTSTDEKGWAVIEVQDNGTGIPREVAARIFDPFFTTKPPGVGTGLGLAICHSIVSTLGGQLSFSSAVGEGTLFRVALPPAPQEAAAPEQLAPAA